MTVVKVFLGIKGGERFCLMVVVVERKIPEIMVMAWLAHLARIISCGPRIIMVVLATPLLHPESCCSKWARVHRGVTTPLTIPGRIK